jgi:uncharacterized alkaline shock family protein YloU
MAMNHEDPGRGTAARDGHPLPCGRTVEAVWEDLEAGRAGPHPDCPHCATSRRSLTELAAATRALVDDPTEPPPGLLDRIMAAVRADLDPADAVALPDAHHPAAHPAALAPGGVAISMRALAAVLRFAVDGVDGLRAQRCRIEPDPADPFTVDVAMTVSVRYGAGTVDAVATARERVRAALSDRVGLTLATLIVEVADVWTDDGRTGDGGTS